MGRAKKSKGGSKKSVPGLPKAMARQGGRLYAGYGDAALKGRKTVKKKGPNKADRQAKAAEEKAAAAAAHDQKIKAILARADKRREKGQEDRAFGHWVEALGAVERPVSDLESRLGLIIDSAARHPLTNAQVKILTKGRAWRKVKGVRLVNAYLLALSGRGQAAELERNPGLADPENALLDALAAEEAPDDLSEAGPWGLIYDLIENEGALIKAADSLAAELTLLRLSRLGISPEARRGVVLDAVARAGGLPLIPRLELLLWARSELGAEDALIEGIDAVVEAQLPALAQIDFGVDGGAALAGLAEAARGTPFAAEFAEQKARADEITDRARPAVLGYREAARRLEEETPEAREERRLGLLRRAFDIAAATGALKDEDLRDLAAAIARLPGASADERARRSPSWKPASLRDPSQRLKNLEAYVKAHPKALNERLALAESLLERSDKSKSLGDKLAAYRWLAEAIALEPKEDKPYTLLESKVPLYELKDTAGHRALRQALDAAAELDGRAAALRAAIAHRADKDEKGGRALFQKGIEVSATAEEWSSLIRLTHILREHDLADAALERARETSEGTTADLVLDSLVWRTRMDPEFKGEDSPSYPGLVEEIKGRAPLALAQSYIRRYPQPDYVRGVAMFRAAVEAEPERLELGVEVLTGAADPRLGLPAYRELSDAVSARHPQLAAVSEKIQALFFGEEGELSPDERAQVEMELRRELLGIRLASLQAEKEREEQAKQTDEGAESEAEGAEGDLGEAEGDDE